MRELINFELTKLLKKKIVFVTVVLFGIIYFMMLYSWIFGNEWAMTQDGQELYGQEAAAYNEEITSKYAGALTDEKVQAILKEFPRTKEGSIRQVSNNTYYPIANLFAEKDGSWNGKTVREVFPEFEEAPLLGMSSRWESFLYSMRYVILFLGMVMIIVVSPVFSEEYSSGMDALILTARHGRTRCVWAKLVASLGFAVLFTASVLGLGLFMLYIGNGFVGWDADIQLSEMMIFTGIEESFSCAAATVWTFGLSMLSILTLTGMTLMFSAISKTSFLSIILAAGVYAAPMFAGSTRLSVRRFLVLCPINTLNISEVVDLERITKAQQMIPIVWMIAGVSAGVWLMGVIVCRGVFARHQVG